MSEKRIVELKSSGKVSWGEGVLDFHIAPGISEFDSAEIPDLRGSHPEAPHWLANHFLNSVFRGRYSGHMRHLAVGFLRRVTHAFDAYHGARDKTLSYLEDVDPSSPNLVRYFAVVTGWEMCVLQLNMATETLKKVTGKNLFEPQDGSALQRAYDAANRVKHLSPESEDDDAVQPLWLTNAGLNCAGLELTFGEVAGVVEEFAEMANGIQDPLSLASEREDESAEEITS